MCYWWCSFGGGCAPDSGGGVVVGSGCSCCFLYFCSALVSDAEPNIPKASYSISCIILKYFEHDMLRLTRSWLISLRYSVICCFHWLLESFSQDGLHCNDKPPVQRSNDRHGGRDEMDKTRKYPQPFAFVIRRIDRKHIDNQG